MQLPRIIGIAFCATLASCTTLPEITDKVNAKPPCCNSMAEFSYEPLAKGQDLSFVLGEDSPVFAFHEGKSYFKAYALPASGAEHKLRVRSRPTGSIALETRKWSQVYCPQVTYLDAEYTPFFATSRVPAMVRGAGFVAEFNVPAQARYVVLHTNIKEYGQLATRYTSGGAYLVGAAVVVERGGQPIHHPCGPVADASVELQ